MLKENKTNRMATKSDIFKQIFKTEKMNCDTSENLLKNLKFFY